MEAAGVSGATYGGEGPSVGPEAMVGDGVYAGGGSFDGTVKAFMPGRSSSGLVSLVSPESRRPMPRGNVNLPGRLVAGLGLSSGDRSLCGLGTFRLNCSVASSSGVLTEPETVLERGSSADSRDEVDRALFLRRKLDLRFPNILLRIEESEF